MFGRGSQACNSGRDSKALINKISKLSQNGAYKPRVLSAFVRLLFSGLYFDGKEICMDARNALRALWPWTGITILCSWLQGTPNITFLHLASAPSDIWLGRKKTGILIMWSWRGSFFWPLGRDPKADKWNCQSWILFLTETASCTVTLVKLL